MVSGPAGSKRDVIDGAGGGGRTFSILGLWLTVSIGGGLEVQPASPCLYWKQDERNRMQSGIDHFLHSPLPCDLPPGSYRSLQLVAASNKSRLLPMRSAAFGVPSIDDSSSLFCYAIAFQTRPPLDRLTVGPCICAQIPYHGSGFMATLYSKFRQCGFLLVGCFDTAWLIV